MGKIAGYKIVLQFDNKTLVGYRSHSMNYAQDFGEATTGASTNQHKEYIPLFKGMKFTVGGLYDPTPGDNKTLDDIINLLREGTKFTAKYGNTEVGSKYYSADAYIESVDQEGDYSDLSSYTVNVLVTGDVTPGTVEA